MVKTLDFNTHNLHIKLMARIRLLKICGDSTYQQLEIIYKECLSLGLFPLVWKRETLSQFIKGMTNSS